MSEQNNSKLKRILPFILVSACVFISYFNALFNEFVYDDIRVIVENPYIRSWGNAGKVLLSGYWSHTGASGGLYRPLAILSFIPEYALAGLNPFLYHLDNVLLHLLCTLMVYLILARIFADSKTALIAAVLFAVHPLHTEAVTFVFGRTELLSTLFSLLTMWFFIAAKDRPLYKALSLVTFLAGLLSKETAAVTPALMAAYLLIFGDGPNWRARMGELVRRLYPYAAVFFLYMGIRAFVLGGLLFPEGTDKIFAGKDPLYVSAAMAEAFLTYVRLALLPVDLNIYYMLPARSILVQGLILLVLMAASAILFARKENAFPKPVQFAIVWFPITLLPVSNIIPTGVYISERAMYMPLVSACMIAGYLAVAGYSYRKVVYPTVAVVVLFFVAGTVHRNADLKDMQAMYTRMIEETPDNPMGYAGYGEYLFTHGRAAEAKPMVEKALSMKVAPVEAHFLLGNINYSLGLYEDSIAEFQKFLQLYSNKKTRIYSLASCNMGLAYGKSGQLDKAIYYLRAGLDIDPVNAQACQDLGVAYGLEGQTDRAIEEFRKSLELDPGDESAQEDLAFALKMKENEKRRLTR